MDNIIAEEIYTLKLVNIDPINKGPYLLETLKVEKRVVFIYSNYYTNGNYL